MNFKQNSLFTRNTGFDEEQADVQGGVLAVWGSPSSGKTTVSVKLADYLARKKKNVLLIFADMTTPPLPCICAAGDLEGEKSLGSILAATHVTENLIKKNCMFYRKNDYLSMVGMLKGENVFTYPPYDQTQAAELIEQAREVVPFVIIDCGRVGSETSNRQRVLEERTGIHPTVQWSRTGNLQLNEEVTVTVTIQKDLGLFGNFGSFPITIRARASGKSEVYWK